MEQQILNKLSTVWDKYPTLSFNTLISLLFGIPDISITDKQIEDILSFRLNINPIPNVVETQKVEAKIEDLKIIGITASPNPTIPTPLVEGTSIYYKPSVKPSSEYVDVYQYRIDQQNKVIESNRNFLLDQEYRKKLVGAATGPEYISIPTVTPWGDKYQKDCFYCKQKSIDQFIKIIGTEKSKVNVCSNCKREYK